MKIASLVARILLGLIFTMSGASVFLALVLPMKFPPPPPGFAGQWQTVFFGSHYVYFVDAFELAAGLLLLFNRYATLGLVILAGVLVNIAIFHITMAPEGLIAAVVIAVLWFLAAAPYRKNLEPIFAAKPLP